MQTTLPTSALPAKGESMNASEQPLIQMTNIHKVFFTDEVETHALSGVHLEIRKGEYVSIAGPSGSGKSTLLAIIGLLDTPTEGEYTLNDHAVAKLDVADRSRIRNREIGFIFQNFNLIRELHREGATICMVTHDPRFARHAERSVHLFDGRVVDETVEAV